VEIFTPPLCAAPIVLPDNDPDGRLYLDAAASSLKEVGASVRVLALPGVAPKGDVIDWERAGGTVEQLHAMIEHEARPWVPGELEPEELPAPGARKRRKKQPAAHPAIWRFRRSTMSTLLMS
jgi:hypothetical protein